VLLEKIGKRLVDQFLKSQHAVAREQAQHGPTFIVDLDALACHVAPRLRAVRAICRDIFAFWAERARCGIDPRTGLSD
jgi:hypothetical protein